MINQPDTQPIVDQVEAYLASDYRRNPKYYRLQALERKAERERRQRAAQRNAWLVDLPYLLASAVLFGLTIWMVVAW